MKKVVGMVLLLMSLVSANEVVGQDGYKQDLLNLATINFPAKPAYETLQDENVYSFFDSTGIYMVTVRKLTKEQVQAVNLNSYEALGKFYEGVIDGTISYAEGTLVKRKQVGVDGLIGAEIEYTAKTDVDLPDLKFARIVYFNKTLFKCSFWPISTVKDYSESARTKFFDSFKITADVSISPQYESARDRIAFAIGYHGAEIVFLLLIIGAVVLCFRFIRNMIKRHNTK